MVCFRDCGLPFLMLRAEEYAETSDFDTEAREIDLRCLKGWLDVPGFPADDGARDRGMEWFGAVQLLPEEMLLVLSMRELRAGTGDA